MSKKFGRRDVFRAAAAGLPLSWYFAGSAKASQSAGERPRIIVSDSNAVVQTAYGRVRGYTDGGILTFKGIPYGASTAGERRFMVPQQPAAWTGVRDALHYGPACPQGASDQRRPVPHLAFLFQTVYGHTSEDCLCLNIWTPGLNDAVRRPVMVWLHGGGFFGGSSFEYAAYDGRNLAERGDVVVVSLHHRLNAFGFLNLHAYGPRYVDSANAGLLDIVAALQWVRENVARFGGNPQNVTLFGQSGGGAKINYLMAMPPARGLFHRAIVQSAMPMFNEVTPATQTSEFAAALLGELGLDATTLDRLPNVPEGTLVQSADMVQGRFLQKHNTGYFMGPVVDGRAVTEQPFVPAAPPTSAEVPLLIGCTLNEGSGSLVNAGREALSAKEMMAQLTEQHGNAAAALVDAVRRTYRTAKPVETYGHADRGASGLRHRIAVVGEAALKHAQGRAPVYAYLFGWKTPVLDGRPRAYHRSELPFVFNNSDRCAHMTGGTVEARELAEKVADAWITFARRGDPNHSGLPKWPPFSPDTVPTMVFDRECEVKNDHDREARAAFQRATGV